MDYILKSEKLNLNLLIQNIITTGKNQAIFEWVKDSFTAADVVQNSGSIAIFFDKQDGLYEKLVDTFTKNCGSLFLSFYYFFTFN